MQQGTAQRRSTPLVRRLVGWAFARFYREFAWTYDAVAWLVSRGLWRRWTLAALPYLDGRILELGCGTGHIQAALAAQSSVRVIGLDASPQMLALTQRRVRRARRSVRLLRAVGQALPFASGRFDTVLATFPTEYILHPATAAEIARVLAPAGRLVIVDAPQFTRNGLYERAVDLAYRLTLQASVRGRSDYALHLRALEQAGFSFAPHWEAVGTSRVLVLTGRRAPGAALQA